MEFTTADLCDAFPRAVQLVEPLFREYGAVAKFAGPVETLRVFEDNALVRQALETQGGGRVLVVDGGGSLRCALVGGKLAALAHTNGWSGVLINGCVRDSSEIKRVPVGIRALNTAPMPAGKKGVGGAGRHRDLRRNRLFPRTLSLRGWRRRFASRTEPAAVVRSSKCERPVE